MYKKGISSSSNKKPWFLVCCKTSLTGADSLTASPLGEVLSRRAAEVGSIEPDEAGKKLVAVDHAFIGDRALLPALVQ